MTWTFPNLDFPSTKFDYFKLFPHNVPGKSTWWVLVGYRLSTWSGPQFELCPRAFRLLKAGPKIIYQLVVCLQHFCPGGFLERGLEMVVFWLMWSVLYLDVFRTFVAHFLSENGRSYIETDKSKQMDLHHARICPTEIYNKITLRLTMSGMFRDKSWSQRPPSVTWKVMGGHLRTSGKYLLTAVFAQKPWHRASTTSVFPGMPRRSTEKSAASCHDSCWGKPRVENPR